ncbi:MAG: ABC transporter ATP-binding protein, partial [Spirochaetia bacterium]
MFKLFRSLKPFTVAVILVIVLVGAQAISELYLPTLMADIVDKGIARGDTPYILRVGGLMLLVALGGVICAAAAPPQAGPGGQGVGRGQRGKVFTPREGVYRHE